MVSFGPIVGFTALVVAVAAQRLLELRRSARNERYLRAHGAIEHAPEQMVWMRALHAAWLVGMLLEAWSARRAPPMAVVVVAVVAFTIGQALRVAAMSALGRRWSVKIFTLCDAPPVTNGIFRVMRHPNYLGVILEIASLPLLGGAYATAIVASALNGALLYARIRAEERALASASSYGADFLGLGRFLPRRPRARSHG